MATKLTRLTQKIAIQLHLVAESCTICSSRSWRPVWKLLDTPSCVKAGCVRSYHYHLKSFKGIVSSNFITTLITSLIDGSTGSRSPLPNPH